MAKRTKLTSDLNEIKALERKAKVIKAGRSNCKLDTTKLVNKLKEYKYEVPEIHEAYKGCFQRMAAAGVK